MTEASRQKREANRAALAFVSADHHRVRDLAVVGLPRADAPLPLAQMAAILEELEQHMTFLPEFTNGLILAFLQQHFPWSSFPSWFYLRRV